MPSSEKDLTNSHFQLIQSDLKDMKASMSKIADALTKIAVLEEKHQLIGWCWENGVDQTATEAAINANLASQITPAVIKPTLLWATAA